jgi:hypothetical protein
MKRGPRTDRWTGRLADSEQHPQKSLGRRRTVSSTGENKDFTIDPLARERGRVTQTMFAGQQMGERAGRDIDRQTIDVNSFNEHTKDKTIFLRKFLCYPCPS